MLNHFYFRLIFPNMHKRYSQCIAMHIMAAIMMSLYTLTFISTFQHDWVMVVAVLPASLAILFLSVFKRNIVVEPNHNRAFRILEIGILIMAGLNFMNKNQIFPSLLFISFACILAFLLYIESRIFHKQFIDVTDNGVDISLPTHNKKLAWFSIHNITVKGDYFTIATIEDQILQYKIFNSLTADEQEQFIIFCKTKLKK